MVRVGAATALSALCGYAVLYLAARDLAPAGFSVFGVFWGAFGLASGAAFGLLQEATREVRSSVRPDSARIPKGEQTHPMRVAAGVGLAAAALIAATSPLWSVHVFVEDRLLSVALLSVGLAGFCLHTTLLGMLAGINRWSEYGALMVTDAVLRVAVAAATFAVGWGLGGYLWATVARGDRVAGDAARVATGEGCCPVADARQHRDVPARGGALGRRGRRQRGPGDGLSRCC